MRPVEIVLERLEAKGCKPRRSGEGWSAKCPSHDDRSPSLSVDEGLDERCLITCHAGCETDNITASLDLTTADLFPKRTASNGNGSLGEPEAIYPYVDAQGELLFEVCRFSGKQFRQRRPNGDGGFNWKLGDARSPLVSPAARPRGDQ